MFAEENDLELMPEGEVIADADLSGDDNAETEELQVEAEETGDEDSGELSEAPENGLAEESLPD